MAIKKMTKQTYNEILGGIQHALARILSDAKKVHDNYVQVEIAKMLNDYNNQVYEFVENEKQTNHEQAQPTE